LSHHIETMGSIQGRVVCPPVGKALQQQGIIGTMVQFHQPGGGAAVLCLEHGEQGSDGTGASVAGHGLVSFELIEVYRQGRTPSERMLPPRWLAHA